MRSLDSLRPSDLFETAKVEEENWTENDCIQKLMEAAMPEKTKERKTVNVTEQMTGGAAIFMPKKASKKRIRYPKDFDPVNPGPQPDPERWLPKWQRSKFKKMAKKRGVYLKGA